MARRTISTVTAAQYRASPRLMLTAWILVGLIMTIGMLDATSTNMGLAAGAQEANGLMAWLQDSAGPLWVLPKMALHALAAAMVLWLPHPAVMAVVGPVVLFNAFVTWNNFFLAGVI